MRLPRFLRPSPIRLTRAFYRELQGTRVALERIADVLERQWAEAHPPTPADYPDDSSVQYRNNEEIAELLAVQAGLERLYGPGRVTDEMVVAEWEARKR